MQGLAPIIRFTLGETIGPNQVSFNCFNFLKKYVMWALLPTCVYNTAHIMKLHFCSKLSKTNH